MDLHERLAALRAMVPDLSNAELDRLCGLRKGHTRSIELNPDANPELKTLQAISSTFGVPVGYLASGEGSEPEIEAVTAAIVRARGGEIEEAPAEPTTTFQHPATPAEIEGAR